MKEKKKNSRERFQSLQLKNASDTDVHYTIYGIQYNMNNLVQF